MMKTLNQSIGVYTNYLKQGEIQIAYKGIMDFFGKLRGDLIKKYPDYDVSGIYQGYMDMTYFSLTTKSLREKGLKIAIVYLHEAGTFEVWLSARNREIAKDIASGMDGKRMNENGIFHDESNPDAIMESTLTVHPDFESQETLISLIKKGVEKFLSTLNGRV